LAKFAREASVRVAVTGLRGARGMVKRFEEVVRLRLVAEGAGADVTKDLRAAQREFVRLERQAATFARKQSRARRPVQGPAPPVPERPRALNLDLRTVFRSFVRAHQARVAAALPGSLAAAVLRAPIGRVARWGYQLRLHELGALLRWYVRGTDERTKEKTGQDVGAVGPHPIRQTFEPDTAGLGAAVERFVVRAFKAWEPRGR
jgi:hypothetical protein